MATLVVVMSVYTGKGRKISKTEGIIFLMVYAGYILYVIQRG